MTVKPETIRESWKRFTSWVDRRAGRLLVVAIIATTLVLTAAGAWKLAANEYDAIDLAIYTQVLEHSLRGDLFGFTIHPHSYLGDHAEFSILALVPFYAIARSPLTLIGVQAFLLSLGALPLYAIARRRFPRPSFALLISLLYLGNAFLQNAALFEYHHLTLFISLALFLLDAYDRRSLGLFAALIAVGLTIREDVGLFLLPFAVLALLDRRRWPWVALPITLGIGGFLLSMNVITNANPVGQYKFLAFYGWLGGSAPELVTNAFSDPMLILRHLATFPNLLFFVGLLLPFLFLPLAAPRALIFLIIPFLQIALGVGGSQLVLQTHYVSPFLPFLVFGTVIALKRLMDRPLTGRFGWLSFPLVLLIVTVTTLYAALTFGPLPSVVQSALEGQHRSTRKLERAITSIIPADAPVGATYEFLTPLARREKLYSLNYAFTGRRQFSDATYVLPDDADFLVLDSDDLLAYQAQYSGDAERYDRGGDRLRQIIEGRGFRVRMWLDRFLVLERGALGEPLPIRMLSEEPEGIRRLDVNFGNGLTLLGTADQTTKLSPRSYAVDASTFTALPLSLVFRGETIERDDHLLLTVNNSSGDTVITRRFPLGYGLLPPREWAGGTIIKMDLRLLLPENIPAGDFTIELSIVDEKLLLTLNGIRSSELKVVTSKQQGPTVNLGTFVID